MRADLILEQNVSYLRNRKNNLDFFKVFTEPEITFFDLIPRSNIYQK